MVLKCTHTKTELRVEKLLVRASDTSIVMNTYSGHITTYEPRPKRMPNKEYHFNS